MNRQDKRRDGKLIGHGIEWTQVYGRPSYTWNPTAGCLHGCTWRMPDGTVIECYAKTVAEGLAQAGYPEGFEHHYWREHELNKPLNVEEPSGIFVGSMADLFGHWVPEDQINRVLEVMRRADWHIFQTLSKYPIRLKRFAFPDNVWVGVSLPAGHLMLAEGAAQALSVYLRHMSDIQARIRFMSIEPLWFDVSSIFEGWLAEHDHLPFEWVIVGAASNGPKLYQPEPTWVSKLVDLFDSQEIPVFFKGNLAENPAADPWREEFPPENPDPQSIQRVPRQNILSGKLIDKQDPQQWLEQVLDRPETSCAQRTRLGQFLSWVRASQESVLPPDLASWAIHLAQEGKSSKTIRTYLSTVRGIYRQEFLITNEFRDLLYDQLPVEMAFESKYVQVEELLSRLSNALRPEAVDIKTITIQDRGEIDMLWLSNKQVRDLVSAPGLDTLAGKRNTAIIGLLLCTGLRAAELCALDVEDLDQRYDGQPALRIKAGKGLKQRYVPYGNLNWGLSLTQLWLDAGGLSAGPAFVRLVTQHRIYYDEQSGEAARLRPAVVRDMLRKYPIPNGREMITANPHALRYTYARALRKNGMDLDGIQLNLGHKNLSTTQAYIGPLDGQARAPVNPYGSNDWISALLDRK